MTMPLTAIECLRCPIMSCLSDCRSAYRADCCVRHLCQRLGYETAGITLGREIVRKRWSLELETVSRRLMRKPIELLPREPADNAALSGQVVPTAVRAVAPVCSIDSRDV